MSLNKKMGMVATTATFAVAGFAVAGGNTPVNGTDARIAALEQQIRDLQHDSGQNWLSEARAEEIRAMVEDVSFDASRRSSLLSGSGSAGHGSNGFFISNDDGSFTLNIGLLAQFRAVWNNRDDSGSDDSIFGFDNPRTDIDFSGNLFGSDFTYYVRASFDYDGSGINLREALGHYQINENMGVAWGQLKAPFLKEEMMSAGNQLAAERSYINELTTAGLTQGVQLDFGGGDGTWRAFAAFTDGFAPSMTGTNGELANTSATASGGTEYAFTGRFEWMVAGEQGWGQFDDFTSWSDDAYGTVIGGAIHFQDSESGTSADETEALAWTIDAQVEGGGWNFFAAVTGTSAEENAGSGDWDQFGLVVQGGVFLKPDEFELFGRWGYYDFDDALGSSFDDEINLLTFGANWYWEGQDKKWTTDVVWSGDRIPDSATNLGILADAADQDGQFVLRSQVQFAF